MSAYIFALNFIFLVWIMFIKIQWSTNLPEDWIGQFELPAQILFVIFMLNIVYGQQNNAERLPKHYRVLKLVSGLVAMILLMCLLLLFFLKLEGYIQDALFGFLFISTIIETLIMSVIPIVIHYVEHKSIHP